MLARESLAVCANMTMLRSCEPLGTCTPLWGGHIYLPCPFTAWIKNCPEFQHLIFFFLFYPGRSRCGLACHQHVTHHALLPTPRVCVPESCRVRSHLWGCLSPRICWCLPQVWGRSQSICFVLFSFPDCSMRFNFDPKVNFIYIS